MNKSKFLYKTKDEKGYDVYWYEYKGEEYCVSQNTEESFPYQHRIEQQNIDIKLENRIKKLSTEDAMIGFQEWWDYLDGKE